MKHKFPNHIDWTTGPFAEAAQANVVNRLQTFIEDEESEPLSLFTPGCQVDSQSGGWYGEHVGKWLVSASHAVHRIGSGQLHKNIQKVVQHLQSVQEPSGYLGTYDPESTSRFTHPQAPEGRTWDLWIHAWLILGLVEAESVASGALDIAKKIGDLLVTTFADGSRSVLEQGNHDGTSSSVVLHALAVLSQKTSNATYADLAEQIVEQMEDRGIPLLTGPAKNLDVTDLATGKAYQLLWNVLGLVELSVATSDPQYQQAAVYWWNNVRDLHLTPFGGPWGGIAGHKEVFNIPGFFDPEGMVETCSTGTWMALSRRLFQLTGDPQYIAEYEKSLLNGLIGAFDANGKDWCYFLFPNGRRNNTYHWACCRSSGALALEESIDPALTTDGETISVNLFLNCQADLEVAGKTIKVKTEWAWQGATLTGTIQLEPSEPVDLKLSIRRPEWAEDMTVEGDLEGTFEPGTKVQVRFQCSIQVHPYTHTVDHHGQEIVRKDFACVSLGPYSYACGLIDGFRQEETLRLARLSRTSNFHLEDRQGEFAPAITLRLPARQPIEFLPFAEAGGRHDHAWRITWLQVAWQ